MACDASLASPWQRQLIVFSTGMGKTITGIALGKKRGGKMLWLAHREELITQPAQALKVVWPEARCGVVKAELNQYMREVVFASVQSAQQPKRLEQLAQQGFKTVVVDEAHHAMSPGYQDIFKALGCFKDGGPTLVGLTATPERSDNAALSDVFQGIVFQVGITTAIAGGYLIAPTVIERPINVDLDAVSVTRGDFGIKQLDVALMQAGIVSEISAAYEEHCSGGRRKSIIFVVSVAQAEAVASSLQSRGHRVVALSGETDKETRKSILKKLHTGEVEAIVNCMVLTEGFDEPSVDCVILGRPTHSKSLMIQKVGRGLRLYPGKKDCLVIDMVGASKRNTLVQAAVLFGIRPDPAEKRGGGTFDPITDPEEYWRQRLLSQIQGVGGAPRSKLRWVPAGDGGGWLLPAGEFGTVRVIAADGDDSWTIDAVGVQGDGPSKQSLYDGPVSMDIAQAIAEDYVRRAKAVTLASKDGKWQGGPATEKQVAFLKRAGVKADGISAGTARDLITQIMAKKNGEPATPKQLAYLRRHTSVSNDITKREAARMIGKLRTPQ